MEIEGKIPDFDYALDKGRYAASHQQPRLRQDTLPKHIAIIYEDRDSWISRAAGLGLSKCAAEEVSYWLCDKYKIEATYHSVKKIAAKYKTEVSLFEIDEFLSRFYQQLHVVEDPLLLWNITDGHASFRGSHIPSLALLHGIPYFGCPPFTQAIGQDKYKLYQLCKMIGVRVPPTSLVENGDVTDTFMGEDAKGPFFIKPNSFGNKVGLTNASLCASMEAARRQAKEVGNRLSCRMLVQKYIQGTEIRLNFIDADAHASSPKFGFEVVNTRSSFIDATTRNSAYDNFVDASSLQGIPEATRDGALNQMTEAVLKIGKHIVLKDYFTFEFRLDFEGRPWLIDFNPGAFLFGGDVEGYTQSAFDQPLAIALFQAMINSFQSRTTRFSESPQLNFRL
jgi:D-alanine-D-alanine ligase-like ATP-grasp enzyme